MRDDSTPRDADTLKVHAESPGGLYLLVATTQVPQIQVLFDGVGIQYTIEAVENEQSSFTFGADITAKEIQSLLDGMH